MWSVKLSFSLIGSSMLLSLTFPSSGLEYLFFEIEFIDSFRGFFIWLEVALMDLGLAV